MSELAQKECIPCKGATPPLKGVQLQKIQEQLGGGWHVVQDHHLEKEFAFNNFRDALAYTNRVGELAEANNHHPDIYLSWGR
jgi:4a-hydroxytetrahydrobiopterin dehydratase